MGSNKTTEDNMAKKQELEKTSSSSVPAHLAKYSKKGTEGIGVEDIAIPRIALLQAISREVAEGLGRPGDFYHLLSDDNLGNELRIIPIITTKAYMLFRPRETGGGLIARADDGVHWQPADTEFQVQLKANKSPVTWRTAETVTESGLADWGSSDPSDPQSLPAATKMLNVLVWLPDFPHLSPSVYTLQRSSLKPGKKFVGKLHLSEVPTYGMEFVVTSERVVGPKGEYLSPIFTGNGFVMDEALVSKLDKMHDHYMNIGVKVQETGLDAEAEVDSNTTPSEKERAF